MSPVADYVGFSPVLSLFLARQNMQCLVFLSVRKADLMQFFTVQHDVRRLFLMKFSGY